MITWVFMVGEGWLIEYTADMTDIRNPAYSASDCEWLVPGCEQYWED